jgi:aminoglycoside phosphotransferase (APT) family kinase protein
MPAAELDVSPDLVRQLLMTQQPDLAGLPVEVVAHGWDNVVCRVGRDLLARMPRREAAARLIRHEQRWLPVLGPRLPLPVPAPVRAGRPGPGYPWPWSIVPFLPGHVAAHNPPIDLPQAAVSLGRFLGALHAPAAPDAPANAFRGVPLADRSATVIENLNAVAGTVDRRAVLGAWEAAVAAPVWDQPPVWVHGDLHPANILVHRGRLSGVIDFGDLTSGDPATDLSVAWMFLPAQCHDDFWNAYRATGGCASDPALWARARGWALALSLVFLAYSADNPQLADIGHYTMRAVLGHSSTR